MGILSGILGNASEVKEEEINKDIAPMLIDEEKIEAAFKIVRDLLIFTDKRLILMDKQGITGNKKEYFSVPYSKISFYSIETAGHLDTDAELNIWMSGHDQPLKKAFKRGASIITVQQILAKHVLH